MFELKGRHGEAKIFTDNADNETQRQIVELLNQDFSVGANVRIMPDCHAGAGCVIGTTMKVTDKVVPNLVGVDIGCGMEVAKLDEDNPMPQWMLENIDRIIREHIPSGFDKRNHVHEYIERTGMKNLACADTMDFTVINHSLGTLGGGNHFIEINKGEDGHHYLVIHSGSRNPGLIIANYYQKIATDNLSGSGIPKELCYLEGDAMQAYLHDMEIAQNYAAWNRIAILDDILRLTGIMRVDGFTSVHNYIEHGALNGWTLRKGAVAAYEGERLIIPMNMRDGSLICKGKGNADWNYSAPHGAGRILSRGQAKRTISLQDFQSTMSGIYSTSISESTLDESPMAYKPMEEIVANIGDTVDVVETIKPIYNFKAG